MSNTQYTSIEQIKDANARAGKYFFSDGAMRFFNSRVSDVVHTGPGGVYFVTSEKFDWKTPRRYTVRQFNPETAGVDDASEFQQFASSDAAHREAARLAKGE